MTVATRPKKKTASERKKTRSPFHPVEQSRIIREPRPATPLMEFIASLDGELEYREAILEFQSEWCDHPKDRQEAISTRYAPQAASYEHQLRCNDCGLIRHRNGRASVRAR